MALRNDDALGVAGKDVINGRRQLALHIHHRDGLFFAGAVVHIQVFIIDHLEHRLILGGHNDRACGNAKIVLVKLLDKGRVALRVHVGGVDLHGEAFITVDDGLHRFILAAGCKQGVDIDVFIEVAHNGLGLIGHGVDPGSRHVQAQAESCVQIGDGHVAQDHGKYDQYDHRQGIPAVHQGLFGNEAHLFRRLFGGSFRRGICLFVILHGSALAPTSLLQGLHR